MNKQTPLVVVGSVIRHKGKLLAIKRAKPPYAGLLSLPGGKVEFCEHISAAALRETKEETGLDCKFEKMLGTFSEILHQPDGTKRHFIVFVAELNAPNFDVVESNEGQLVWIEESKWETVKDQFIASDYHIVKEFLASDSKMEMREVKMSEKRNGDETIYELEEFK